MLDPNNEIGDGAPVRVAANGNTVYAAFQHLSAPLPNGDFTGDVVVVRDDNAGASGFHSLNQSGVTVGLNVDLPHDGTKLGQERLGSDLSIAVNPNNPNMVAVAYVEAINGNDPGVYVKVSTNAAATWDTVLLSKHSALPALSFADNGALGLLYAGSAATRGDTNITIHFIQTDNPYNLAFASLASNLVLATFSTNAIPIPDGTPPGLWLGDYFDLTSVSNRFYGSFAAPNFGDTNAFPLGVTFLRDTVTNADGVFMPANGVASSIDPFVFSTTAVPEPSTFFLLVVGLLPSIWLIRKRAIPD